MASIVVMSGCVTRPAIDYSKIEQSCAMQCQMNDQDCASRYAGFPLILQAECNPAVEACVHACPPINGATTINQSTKSQQNSHSTTEKLNELNSLYKNGLINQDDYELKKKQILNEM